MSTVATNAISLPSHDDLFNPILAALRSLGDSAALGELQDKVAAALGLSEDFFAQTRVRYAGTPREQLWTYASNFKYNVRWALSYLKIAGFVNNSRRGVWSLTEQGREIETVDPRAILSKVRAKDRPLVDEPAEENIVEAEAEQERLWSDELIATLQELAPDAFERLAQRVLREAGFTEVIVTGRSGDGGIDGRGLVQLNDLVSLKALFQCKRYRSNVGPAEIREFQGALNGRADRGIFVTTAGFTAAAVAEASRDGAIPVDLVDGERLANLLKQFGLGVQVEMVEQVTVDKDWFNTI